MKTYDTVGIILSGSQRRLSPAAIAECCVALRERVPSVTLELPVLFQADMEWLQRLVFVMGPLPITLVVNDWGTLYLMARGLRPLTWVLHIGRWLSYSFYNSPGYENILNQEDDRWRGYNIANESTLAMLEELGVTGIEVDAHPDADIDMQQWRRRGFRVTAFVSQPRASLFRTVIAERWGVIGPGAVDLTPQERWIRFEDRFVPISVLARDALGPLCARDDTVTRRVSLGTMACLDVDAVCSEWHWDNG